MTSIQESHLHLIKILLALCISNESNEIFIPDDWVNAVLPGDVFVETRDDARRGIVISIAPRISNG